MRDRSKYQRTPRMENPYIAKDIERQHKAEFLKYKQKQTDDLYNSNSLGENIWRNTKKFATVAIPALVGYGLLKGQHVGLQPGDGPGLFTLKTIGATAAAIPTVGAATVAGVMPYTYLRSLQAEKRQNDEDYQKFKFMQNKVLADNNLLVYNSPESKIPGSKFIPQFMTGKESRFSEPKRDYSEAIAGALITSAIKEKKKENDKQENNDPNNINIGDQSERALNKLLKGDCSEIISTVAPHALRTVAGAAAGAVYNNFKKNKQLKERGIDPDSEEGKQFKKGSTWKGALAGGALAAIAPAALNSVGEVMNGTLPDKLKSMTDADKLKESTHLNEILSKKGELEFSDKVKLGAEKAFHVSRRAGKAVLPAATTIALMQNVVSPFKKAKENNSLLKYAYDRKPKAVGFSEECTEKYEGLINSLVCSYVNDPKNEYELNLERTLDTIEPSDKIYFITCLNEAIAKEEAFRKPSVEITAQSFSERCPFLGLLLKGDFSDYDYDYTDDDEKRTSVFGKVFKNVSATQEEDDDNEPIKPEPVKPETKSEPDKEPKKKSFWKEIGDEIEKKAHNTTETLEEKANREAKEAEQKSEERTEESIKDQVDAHSINSTDIGKPPEKISDDKPGDTPSADDNKEKSTGSEPNKPEDAKGENIGEAPPEPDKAKGDRTGKAPEENKDSLLQSLIKEAKTFIKDYNKPMNRFKRSARRYAWNMLRGRNPNSTTNINAQRQFGYMPMGYASFSELFKREVK